MKEYKIVATKRASTKLAKRMEEAFGLYCKVESEVIKPLEGGRVQVAIRLIPYVKAGLTIKLQNQAIGFLKGYRFGHDDGHLEKVLDGSTNLEIEEVGVEESQKTKLATRTKPDAEKTKGRGKAFLFEKKGGTRGKSKSAR